MPQNPSFQILAGGWLHQALSNLLGQYPDTGVESDASRVLLVYAGDRWRENVQEMVPSSWQGDHASVAFLTAKGDDVVYAVLMGMRVFIGIEDSLHELLEGIDCAARGRTFCSRSLQPALLEAIRVVQQAPHDAMRGDGSDLTAREREVARLAAIRLSNKEIAQELAISISTVKSHLRNAYRKLGIGCRAHLSCPVDVQTTHPVARRQLLPRAGQTVIGASGRVRAPWGTSATR
jgi:DNA-binding NarL/FixJ family response regulator